MQTSASGTVHSDVLRAHRTVECDANIKTATHITAPSSMNACSTSGGRAVLPQNTGPSVQSRIQAVTADTTNDYGPEASRAPQSPVNTMPTTASMSTCSGVPVVTRTATTAEDRGRWSRSDHQGRSSNGNAHAPHDRTGGQDRRGAARMDRSENGLSKPTDLEYNNRS